MPFSSLEIFQIEDFDDLSIIQIYPQSETVIELAKNQSSEVYAIAGLPGLDAASSIAIIAETAISALKAVKLLPSGKVGLANSDTLIDASSFYGITVTSTSLPNQTIQVKTQGLLEDSSFNFITNQFVFIDSNGQLTQNQNSSIIMAIGYAISPTKILIKIQTPIIKG